MSVWILLKMMLNYSSNQFLHFYCFNVFRYVIWAQTLTADENTKIEEFSSCWCLHSVKPH